jgi:D-sedoheptulose 7-phosphate isomerase
MTDEARLGDFPDLFIKKVTRALDDLLNDDFKQNIRDAESHLLTAYRGGHRIFVFGNGGSRAMASHWVSDFNKTIFNGTGLPDSGQRFRAIRIPTTEEELTAWANDVGYDMVFAGPLANYLEGGDIVIAISSSGNSPNIIKAVELANKRGNLVIGVSGFDGGRLNQLADIKILVKTEKGEYEIVESVHSVIFHLLTWHFRNFLDKKNRSI